MLHHLDKRLSINTELWCWLKIKTQIKEPQLCNELCGTPVWDGPIQIFNSETVVSKKIVYLYITILNSWRFCCGSDREPSDEMMIIPCCGVMWICSAMLDSAYS